MSYGPSQVFTGTIASGASTVTSIDLGTKGYSRVFAEVGTMSTNAALTVFGSSDGTNFKPVFERVNTAPVQYQTLTVATGTIGGIADLTGIAGIRYAQFQASAVISGGCTIKLICVD